MKRATGLVLIILAFTIVFISSWGILPFVPVFDSSMEPALPSGGILTVVPINPKEIMVGDIIIYNIPPKIRDYYNYPPTISHRVIKVQTEPSPGFRTAGDNTGEDPFTIGPVDIRGKVGKQIPYLGLPFFLFRNQYNVIFVIIIIILLTLILYAKEINRNLKRLHRGNFSPVPNKEKQVSQELSGKIEIAEKKMDTTEQALLQFSRAIADYASHLASHTSAIQGLSQASQELKKGAAEQNRVLSAIMENVVISSPKYRPSVSIKEISLVPANTILNEEKPATIKIPPYHAALYKKTQVKPSVKIENPSASIEKAKLIVKKLVSATSELAAKNEKLIIIAREPELIIEKPALSSTQSAPEIEHLIPAADKTVINTSKPEQPGEKPSKTKDFLAHHPIEKPIPSGCVRERQESLWI
jgi:signal peptidase I